MTTRVSHNDILVTETITETEIVDLALTETETIVIVKAVII